MKKFIYLFILIFLVFGCSSSVNNDELDQLQKQIDEHQKDIESKQQSDSETVKKDTEISDDQNQQNQKLTTCKLFGGELVDDGWAGKDTGSNYCNQCRCMNGDLSCTEMACLVNDSSVKTSAQDTSRQDDSKSKSEDERRKKDEEESKRAEEERKEQERKEEEERKKNEAERKRDEEQRKKDQSNQNNSKDKKEVKAKPYYEDNCSFKPEIVLKVYGDVEDHKIDSVQKAINELDIITSGIKVPVYILLWEVEGEKGLDKKSAEILKDFIISKFFPNPSADDGMVKHVTEDIINKVQRETITADYYSESCAAAMFIAATNVLDFKNYLGKIVFHEFHHVWDSSFYANSPQGDRENPAWMIEGMAEYDGLIKSMAMNWTNQNYFNTEISNIKSKLISNPSYIDIDKDIFSFCDRCPVNSIERGIVVIDYIMSNYVETDFDTFANKYYSDLNKFGWKKALSNAVGDYAVFKNSFKQYVLP